MDTVLVTLRFTALNMKMLTFVESKTSSLEQQLGIVSAKLESFLVSFMTTSKTYCNESKDATSPSEKYLCEICDFVAENKTDITEHKQHTHVKTYSCSKCEFRVQTSMI